MPIALISLGSSKLYHYAYPFLPPLTLAAGYLVALVVMLGAGRRPQAAGCEDDESRGWRRDGRARRRRRPCAR